MLEIKDLTFRIRGNILFNGISAEFFNGEITGIAGTAGSGKSTLLDLIVNKNSRYEGLISIDGVDIKDIPGKEFKKIIALYSRQKNITNPEAVVREWVLGGRVNHKKILGPYKDIDRETAFNVISMFRLGKFTEAKLRHISDSAVQMTTIARSFAAEPDILLLDNPEAGLNIDQKTLLAKGIKKYTASGNRLVIIASSDLNFIASVCDKIIVLAENRISATGTQNIITGDFIKKYFSVEAVVTKNIYTGLPEIQIIEES